MVIPDNFFPVPIRRCCTNLLIFNSMSLVPMNNLQLLHCRHGVLDVVWTTTAEASLCILQMYLLDVFFLFRCFFFLTGVICATVIECGSKKALRKTQGWLPGGFAQSRGNFPHRRPDAVVCQPPLAPLAAIVPTAVNHALYESEEQSIARLMNPNSSQLFRVGIHSRIWRIRLGTWIAKRQGVPKAGRH